jgi:hypothetical protein
MYKGTGSDVVHSQHDKLLNDTEHGQKKGVEYARINTSMKSIFIL